MNWTQRRNVTGDNVAILPLIHGATNITLIENFKFKRQPESPDNLGKKQEFNQQAKSPINYNQWSLTKKLVFNRVFHIQHKVVSTVNVGIKGFYSSKKLPPVGFDLMIIGSRV